MLYRISHGVLIIFPVDRTDEKNHKAETASLMEFGSQWEKVAKLVNLTPSANEKPGSSKVARMRSLLIQLKNDNSDESK